MPQVLVEISDDLDEVDGYTIGDITIVGNNKTISTKQDNHHNVIVFISLTMLLDVVLQTIRKQGNKRHKFSAVDDSQFEVFFQKSKRGTIATIYNDVIIDLVSVEDFARALYKDMAKLYEVYSSLISTDSDDVLTDFAHAYSEFSNYIENNILNQDT